MIWTIYTDCGSSADTVNVTFNTPVQNIPCPGAPSFVYDGQTYNTVQIGTQCWMKENLNIGTMVLSTNDGEGTHSDVSDNGIIEKYCYNNDSANCAIYGGLYDWNEMMSYITTPGTQGICPAGWHIPTDGEWCTLTTYLDPTINCSIYYWTGATAGGKMKETGYTHWYSPNAGATNESGFTSLGAGGRGYGGTFGYLNQNTTLWSSSEYSISSAFYWLISSSYATVWRDFYSSKTSGATVRCLKD